MSKHQTDCWLYPEDFDDAVEKVIDLLCESDATIEGKTKAFIVCGWKDEGLGACALFRAIAELLKSTICDDSDMRKHFGKILHVDCSLWKNKRTMQRAIAEELNLHHVMPIFDKQDEDDDFRGVDDSSREEISSIGSLINESLRNEKFLMIFHYGGHGDIDLAECGIPLFSKGKLLCANHGRFEVAREKPMLIPSFANIYIYMYFASDGTFSYSSRSRTRHVLHEEAVGVTADIGVEGINPAVVLDCLLYSLFLTAQLPEDSTGDENGWATHACNYWICGGILGEDGAWEIGHALYRVMLPLGYSSDGTRRLSRELEIQGNIIRTKQKVCWWYPVTSNKLESKKEKLGEKSVCNVPDWASTYFLASRGDDPVYVHNDLFQLANNLRVLKLCNCSFDFASSPFQSCHNLRFLWLDKCTNAGEEQSGVPIFPNLLVFDLRFTDYVLLPQMIELMTNLRELNTKGVSWKAMSHVWKILQKLHKLRVTRSSDVVSVDSCSPIDMMNLELLDLSGNTHMQSLPTLSSARSLKTLVLDGCSSLENVVLEGAPPLLKSFSFDGYGPEENWTHSIQLPQKELRRESPIATIEIVQVTKISLQGCGRLQNIYLRALPNLEELDLSGTAIKTLDLLAMDIPKLKKLFLLGCQQLRSLILGRSPRLEVLHVDTQGKKRSVVCCGGQRSFNFHAFIAFTDGRFTWSFIHGLHDHTSDCLSKVYLLISGMSHSQANFTKSIKEIVFSQEDLLPTRPLLPYSNIALTKDVTCSSLVWNHTQLQTLDVHIEIGEGSYNLESIQDIYFTFFHSHVQSLHVHDNSSITVIPPAGGARWRVLRWCHVERCPKLHTVFSREDGLFDDFKRMRTLSACDLLMVYCIWGRGFNSSSGTLCLQELQHIYLYNCPKLVFLLPISFTLPGLETLQIAYCSNLRHVFPLDNKYPEELSSGVTFKNLKHIKLYHLHKLEQICDVRLTAPALQMISLRDCCGLRRLPAVARQGRKPVRRVRKPVVDCEKDWWNKLEWDGLDAGHDPSLFETRHSAYYKKALPRVSVLR